jgi:hypothetical protein
VSAEQADGEGFGFALSVKNHGFLPALPKGEPSLSISVTSNLSNSIYAHLFFVFTYLYFFVYPNHKT